MSEATPFAATALDPLTGLAVSMHGQPGVYALLLGAGVSRGVGMPTGWDIVQQLVDRARRAAAGGIEPSLDPAEVDPEAWWADHGDGQPLGYSNLLEQLAPGGPAARRALLASFLEPTEEDLQADRKVPGAAHQAIAELVRRGSVRVILTTNFDGLIEQALTAIGVPHQVVATPSAIQGMEPLTHARCTVIKLHGDYTRIDQLNTVTELSSYPEEWEALLRRVLDEYGLIVNGWSADWDLALVAAVEATRNRRYPLVWASWGPLGAAAQRLVDQYRAALVRGPAAAAEELFPDLLSRLEALDSMSRSPLSKSMAVAQVKRLLPEPTRHIQLRDLFDAEIDRIRGFLQSRDQSPDRTLDAAGWQATHDELAERTDTLLNMLVQGITLDRDRQHDDLWVWVITQMMRARRRIVFGREVHTAWDDLQHYPAALALKAATFAAVAAGRDYLMLRLLREPTWREQSGQEDERPAWNVLNDRLVLDPDAVQCFPRWNGTRWRFPQSHLFRDVLRPLLAPLVGDETSYSQTFSRTEYRTALVQRRANTGRYRAAPGEFVGSWPSNGYRIWEADFRANSDPVAWGWGTGADGEKVRDAELSLLAKELEGHKQSSF